jgi:hypothetical protein
MTLTTQADPAAQKAMETLTAQWYNAVVTGCGLDPATFQLAQGFPMLGTDSPHLWAIFDAIPPASASHYWNPAQVNSFASTYGGVINNLVPQNANSFQTAMGDYYALWMHYLATGPALPADGSGVIGLFDQWQQMNMPPDQGQSALTAWQQVAQGVVPVAVQMWLDAGGARGMLKAYNQTYQNLTAMLTPSTPGKAFSMNSATESSDVSHSWAQGEAGGFYDFFEGGASGSWDKLTKQVAQAGVEIEASFKHLVTFTAGPLAQPATDPILSQYKPWYSSEALSLAFHHDDNFVWKTTPPSWDDTFGPAGNLRFQTTGLVIVSGVTVTVTSAASFSQSDQESVKTATQFGFFPFFEAEASGGWSHDFEFSDSGAMTVTSTVPEGVFVVLGALVTPIASSFGS